MMSAVGTSVQAYQVQFVRVPSRHVAVHRFRARPEEIGQKMGEAFGMVMRYAGMHGLQVHGPGIGHYTMHGREFEVAAGFVVDVDFQGDDEVGLLTLPAGEVATTTHVGPYDHLMEAYEAVQAHARQVGRKLDEHVMWEEYLTGPEVPMEQQRTVVRWPVA